MDLQCTPPCRKATARTRIAHQGIPSLLAKMSIPLSVCALSSEVVLSRRAETEGSRIMDIIRLFIFCVVLYSLSDDAFIAKKDSSASAYVFHDEPGDVSNFICMG